MKYTVSEAAKIVGIKRQTMYRHIEGKPVSVELDDDGKQMIDASELIRVYGNDINFESVNENNVTAKSDTLLQKETSGGGGADLELAIMKMELAAANEKLSNLKERSEQDRDNADDEKRDLRDALKHAQASITLQIEDQRKKEEQAGEWKKITQQMREDMANDMKTQLDIFKQEAARDKELLRRKALIKIKAHKEALEAEKNKSFLQKIFG